MGGFDSHVLSPSLAVRGFFIGYTEKKQALLFLQRLFCITGCLQIRRLQDVEHIFQKLRPQGDKGVKLAEK